jgi:hypothetical protein
MGIARLLAKGWTVLCLFAAAHALRVALLRGVVPPIEAAGTIGVCAVLFIAMGLVFILGYAAAADHGSAPLFDGVKPEHLLPSFDDVVFVLFVILSFAGQTLYAPDHAHTPAVEALRAAMSFAVPGQHALESMPGCVRDAGREAASAFAWLLAIVYLFSAASRVRLAAGLIRLQRGRRAEALGPVIPASVLGIAAVAGFQLLYMGSAFNFLGCGVFTEISGALLVGLAPLMLAYLMVAAAANLLAMGPE